MYLTIKRKIELASIPVANWDSVTLNKIYELPMTDRVKKQYSKELLADIEEEYIKRQPPPDAAKIANRWLYPQRQRLMNVYFKKALDMYIDLNRQVNLSAKTKGIDYAAPVLTALLAKPGLRSALVTSEVVTALKSVNPNL